MDGKISTLKDLRKKIIMNKKIQCKAEKSNLAVGGQQVKATKYKRIELLDREKPPEHYDHTDLTTFRKTNKQEKKYRLVIAFLTKISLLQ